MFFDFMFFVFQQIWFFAGISILIWAALSHMSGRRYDFFGTLIGIISVVIAAIFFVLEMLWSLIASIFSKNKDDAEPSHKED
jgi:hypothetical protein